MKTFLQAIHPVADEILEDYMAHWETCAFPKKTLITAEGEIQSYMYFVLEGIQKSYYLHDDKQHVIAFTYPPSFSGIPESFFTQSPSRYFLEAITDSRFLRISFSRHQTLMQEHRPIETLFRKATEHLLIGQIERHYELMAFDIQTRFVNLIRRSPQLLNRVPHKDLASYLRIDPTNFSKLLGSVQI